GLTGAAGRRRLLGGSARVGAGLALGLVAAHGNGAAVAAPQQQDAETPLRMFDALNQGTPLEQLEGFITPNRLFFLRNHFATPTLSATDWTLTVDGAVQRPVTLTLDDLRALPSRSQLTGLECAGNGRGGCVPPAEGTQWDVSAVGTAEWTGVSLATVLDRVGLQPDAIELVFQGGDNATFQRSLTRAHALQTDVMLAWAMNGE